jgi:tetratricopeptide (TPR) repeat protein
MIQEEGSPEWLRMTVALAHHFAGLPADAYRILEEGGKPEHAYQMACCAARMGRYSVSLEHLIEAIELSEANRVRALLDEDFEPLWEHFASGAANFQECTLLASRSISRCFEPVPAYDGSQDYFDHFDFQRLSEHLRSAVRPRLLSSTYVARQPGDRGYDDQLSNELFCFRVTEGVNRRGRATAAWDMARRAMLVLTEAETCATAGNMMYARWHLSEILRNLPIAAADIGGYCVNEKLRLLADEFGTVEEFRPRFTADASAAYEAKDLNRLAEILKSCPPPLLSLGIIQIYNGHLALAAGDKETAIHAYLAAADCWPDDAAPVHNAALALAEIGRWDEAAELIAHAPLSFKEVGVAQSLAAKVASRDLNFNPSAASHKPAPAPPIAMRPPSTP